MRYRMLETVREYALEKLRAGGEEEAARNRHLAYYVDLASEVSRDRGSVQGVDTPALVECVEGEIGNFRAALAWSHAPSAPPESSLRLAATLWPFWEMRGYHTEGREHLRAALDRPGLPDLPERAQVLLGAATLAFVQAELDQALGLGRESLERFRALGDARGIAGALLLLGSAFLESNDITAARALLMEGRDYCRQCGWMQGSALFCVHLGIAALRTGDTAEARSLLEQGAARAEKAGETLPLALALHSLGYLALETGDLGRARLPLTRSLQIWRRFGHKHKISLTLRHLGQLARYQKDWERALSFLDEAVVTCRDQGNRIHLAVALQEIGNVHYEREAYEQARSAYVESLDLFLQFDSGRGHGFARNTLGSTLFHLGDAPGAQALHREALGVYLREESEEGIVWTLERFGVAEAVAGAPQKAIHILAAASTGREGLGIPLARWDQADWEAALTMLCAALGEAAFANAWTLGRTSTTAQAAAYVLETSVQE